MLQELSPEKLRRMVEPGKLPCGSSEQLEPLKTVIGQERAVRALRFGLGIKAVGFNIFIAGLPGTGRTTAATAFLKELAKDQPVPPDWCYVNTFRDAYRPRSLQLPAGRARVFRGRMKTLIDEVRREIPRVFESDEYAAKRDQTVSGMQQQRNEIFSALNARAQREGFAIQASPMGLFTVPIKDGKPLDEEGFQALSKEEQEAIQQKREMLQTELKNAIRAARSMERSVNEELQKLDREVALFTISPFLEELKDNFADLPEVVAYLDEVQDHIIENLSQFRSDTQEQQPTPMPPPGSEDLLWRKYQVNILVDNSDLEGAPVIIELNPTYNNLFGRIEKEAQFGALLTDFTLIREGSLHRANGGYLLLPAEELLRNPLSWDGLKRALRNGEVVIEEPAERMGFMTTKTLRPESIALNTKVVLIGQPMIYQLLYAYDEDFRELFKVKADFDSRMERDSDSLRDYISFICTVCRNEQLKHLDGPAMAKIAEYGSRLADDQTKLSTRFGEISDIIREANHYAMLDDAELVSAQHVKKAIDERFYRSSLLQERVREMIERGSIMIDVAGDRVGQVNGLSVVGLGDIAFGQPSRITASVGLGQDGLIDIEREAKLGGPIHTKGVLILSGYLAEQFAQDKPLSLSARLVFEQSYGGVEGDSASSAELYALLSSVSELPLKQSYAVTGSVNQKGEVQAIGGANEKVEGFFEVCKAKGLTGEQGVLLPASNVQNLMLKEDVVEAVSEGKFHVWAVESIDEGIEILTGVKAGRRRDDGTFEEGTVKYLVDKRLKELSETLQEFRNGNEASGGKKDD